MTNTHRSRRGGTLSADHAVLLEIAEVLDVVCAARRDLDPSLGDENESALRIALFALLDQPSQARWEKVREVEVVPAFLTGLPTPSPLGLTLGDAVYAFGLPDLVCPSRTSLLRALRWVVGEYGTAPRG